MENAAFSDDGVDQVGVTCETDLGANCPGLVSVGWGDVYGLTIKLVLDDVVEDLQEEEDQVMVLGGGEEEPGCGEGLQEVEQLVRRHHGQTLQIGRDCSPKKTQNKTKKIRKVGNKPALQCHNAATGGDI